MTHGVPDIVTAHNMPYSSFECQWFAKEYDFEFKTGLELNGKHQLLVYADNVNVLGENVQTIRENAEIFIKTSKDIGLEVNILKRLNI